MSYTLWDSVGGCRGMVLAFFAALLLGGACTKNNLVQGRCNKSSDCANGLVCDDLETCVPATASSAPCSQDAQCGSGYSCDDLGWCVCGNKGATGGNVCANGSSVIYRGVETDGGAPGGAGGAAGSAGSGGAGGKGDGSTNVGGSGGFVCHADNECPTGKGKCLDGGVCVACTGDGDCTTPTSPICDTGTNTCVPCTTDAQCVAKLGSTGNPGVCMFHTDGHCAIDNETVYVQNVNTGSGCLSVATAGGGTASMPFCSLFPAIVSADTRTLFVVRGATVNANTPVIAGNATPLSIVGQMSATMAVGAAQAGLHVTGSDVYVRDVRIKGNDPTATIGIIADGNATIRLDGADIEGMAQGGLRVTASSYDIINSILAGNGGTRDDGNRSIGGAWLLDTAPDAGVSGRFAFNTVVSNQQSGVACGASSQTIDASLLAKNLGGGTTPDYDSCDLASTSKALGSGDPMLTSTFRATANSPCVDFVTIPPAGAPNHDIDLVTRPQGAAFDCGASEYKAP